MIVALALAAATASAPTQQASDIAKSAQVQAYADCIVANAPDFATKGLHENWSPDRYVPELPRRLWDVCSRNGITIGRTILDMRYAIAWALLKQGKVTTEPLDFASVPALPTAVNGGTAVTMLAPGETPEQARILALAERERDRVLATIAECVVRTKSAETLALLFHSNDHQAKVDALLPTVSACTPPHERLELPQESLTGLLAWTYVRLALTAEDAGNTHA